MYIVTTDGASLSLPSNTASAQTNPSNADAFTVITHDDFESYTVGGSSQIPWMSSETGCSIVTAGGGDVVHSGSKSLRVDFSQGAVFPTGFARAGWDSRNWGGPYPAEGITIAVEMTFYLSSGFLIGSDPDPERTKWFRLGRVHNADGSQCGHQDLYLANETLLNGSADPPYQYWWFNECIGGPTKFTFGANTIPTGTWHHVRWEQTFGVAGVSTGGNSLTQFWRNSGGPFDPVNDLVNEKTDRPTLVSIDQYVGGDGFQFVGNWNQGVPQNQTAWVDEFKLEYKLPTTVPSYTPFYTADCAGRTIGVDPTGLDWITKNTNSSATAVYSNDIVDPFGGANPVIKVGGTAQLAPFGGQLFYFPANTGSGDEVWIRWYQYFPAGFCFSQYQSNDFKVKWMRIQQFNPYNQERITLQMAAGTDYQTNGASTCRTTAKVQDVTIENFMFTGAAPITYKVTSDATTTPLGSWHALQMYVKVSDQLGGGTIRVWLDNTLVAEDNGRTIMPGGGYWKVYLGDVWNGGFPVTQQFYWSECIATTETPDGTDAAGNPYIDPNTKVSDFP